MAWVKIDDQFPDHPKVIEAGSGPGWLYVKALCWSSRNLTDGFVPSSVAVHLVSPESADQQRDDLPWKFPEILVSVGLWEEADGGYKIHDYLKYNPSRKQVLMTRKEAKERMQTVRKKFPTRSSEVQTSPSPSPSPSRSPEEEQQENTNHWGSPEGLVAAYNSLTPAECPEVERLSPGRRQKALTYLKAFPDRSFWEQAFTEIGHSQFLRGLKNAPGHGSFVADFDWLLSKGKDGSENVLKVQEGKYRDGS